jgi:hypothetical protein
MFTLDVLGFHGVARLQPERDAAVRGSEWLDRLVSFMVSALSKHLARRLSIATVR